MIGSGLARKTAELCRWMLNYEEAEIVLISLGILALSILLTFVAVRVVKVMIIGEEYDEND
jgi:hypothetical protein